ncbi:MAG: undecaprenyl-diphosphatase UppP [Treponema sp.]|nr:undecaprenyl-diphosphatase UppP [Treponema sp.]
MLAFQSLILGIFQGLSEFIPISSSAHLVIIPWLFNWKDPAIDSLTFDVELHLGTLVAVIVFFASDIWRLLSAWVRSIVERKIGADPDRRMAWYLFAACIPGGIVGVLFEHKVQTSFHEMPIPQLSMILMAVVIALLGGLMWLADSLASHKRSFDKLSFKDSILIGVAQALAIFPGVSRSGSTITAGLALGLERETAARFSFLLSAPIILGAGLKSLYDFHKSYAGGGISSSELAIFPIGFLAAAVAGFLCIKFLMAFLKKHSTKVFAWYRLALAAFVLVVALVRG